MTDYIERLLKLQYIWHNRHILISNVELPSHVGLKWMFSSDINIVLKLTVSSH